MSVSTITTTTDGVHGLCFAGQRALVRLTNGNLLLAYTDGTDLASREGVDVAGLASASKKTILAGEYKAPVNSTLLSSGEWFGYEATLNTTVYGRYNYTPLPTATWASVTFGSGTHSDSFENARGFVYTTGGTDYLHLQIGYWSNFAIGDAAAYNYSSQMGSAGESTSNYSSTPYGSNILRCAYDSSSHILYWDVNDPLTTAAGNAFPSATSLETDTGGTSNYQDNLATITDSAGNAWLAWQDGAGIAVRCLPAGIGSPTNASFAAKVYVDTSATADLPNLFQDKNGNVWAVWKSSDANQDIQAQKLTYSSGISKVGGVVTLSSGAATRQRLSCIEADASNLYAVWVEGAASPYNIVAATYSLSSVTTSTVNAGASLALKATNLTQSAGAKFALKATNLTVAGGASFAIKAAGLSKNAGVSLALKAANLSTASSATLALKASGVTVSAGSTLALKAASLTRNAGASLALKAANLTVAGGAALALKASGLTASAAATLALSGGASSSVSASAHLALKATNLTTAGGASLALKATGLTRNAGAALALKASGLTAQAGASMALSVALSQSAAASLALKAAGLTKSAAAALALKASGVSVQARATFALSGAVSPTYVAPTGVTVAVTQPTGVTVAL